MIHVENLKKNYEDKVVLRGVTLSVKKGSCTALVGRNGSGKSTLIDIICQIKQANGGVVRYDFDEGRMFEYMGVQTQDSQFDGRLKVKDIISLWQSIYGDAKADLDELLDILELKPIMDNRSDRISGGQRQKLSILLSLLHDPELLIFDELTTGLDATTREDVQHYLKLLNLKRDKTIFIVSHYMDEVEALCDQVYFLKGGVIFASGSPAEIKKKYACGSLQEFVKQYMGKEVG